jgi:aminocarboxymuconate-semialdehyde decarboxylase
MESDKQSSYPGKILDLAIDQNIISEVDRDEMWEGNVLQWLFGEDDQAKKELRAKILS